MDILSGGLLTMLTIPNSNAPVTLEAVHPAVRGFIWWRNHEGHLISSTIWWFHHTTGSISHGCGHWAKCPCPSTIVWGLYAITQWWNAHLPPLALCRCVTLKDDLSHNLFYTVVYIFSYHGKKFICAYVHGTKCSGKNFKTSVEPVR